MIGPVSTTGRVMMASLQQAIQKGMPPDQAIQYVKGMATQGVAPLADLYSMMNQFQRLKQQQVQPPQTPPTIRDQLNMMDQMQRGGIQQMQAPAPVGVPMDRGLGAIDAGRMEYPQFAGGGIVAFVKGESVVGDPDSAANAVPEVDPIEARVVRQYVPDFDTLPPVQQNMIKERLAPQIEAARTAISRGPSSAASMGPAPRVPTLAEQRVSALQRANRPVSGYEAEIAAKAAAAGEGEAAKGMREKLQQRLEGLDKGDKKSRGLALAQIGSQIMEAASRPGATAFGSIGAGLSKGLPLFEQLEQRQQDLKERYEDRMLQLQQADELRKVGYAKEAAALQAQATTDLRTLERASAENELAMERVRYQESAATERTNIQAGAAAGRQAARERALMTAVVDKTKKRLTAFGSRDPAAREYQKALNAVGKARDTKNPAAIQTAEAAANAILQREIKNEMRDYQLQSGFNPVDPLGLLGDGVE